MWRKCSSCKTDILFDQRYYSCSVSTCNGLRTGYVFCSVSCFERHLPGARHRDAAAVEMKSPAQKSQNQIKPNIESSRGPERKIVNTSAQSTSLNLSPMQQEVLVIASRLKEFIQKQSDFNTSTSVMDVLSQHLRIVCSRAIDNARAEGRKTVMDRDFQFLKNTKF